MKSIWHENNRPAFSTLQGEKKTDVAVIGAGMAGVLTACLLKKKGVDAVVLEKGRFACGVTQNTTAKITAQHHFIYHYLQQKMGHERAQMYALANQNAITDYKNWIEQENISCNFEEKPSYIYETRKDCSRLVKEERAAKAFGIPADIVTQCDLPFPITGALRFLGQAQFHPLQFLSAVASQLEIYEHSGVKSIDKDTLITNQGQLHANKIVFATHYPFVNFPGFYFMRQHQERSYVVSAVQAAQVNGMYLAAEKNGYSFRNYRDFLLLGGSGHRSGESGEEKHYKNLEQALLTWYPKAQIANMWSAQDCLTHDKIPYIGRFSRCKPHWFVATGFGKWGMTTSMVAANLLCDLILEKKSPYEELYSPTRHNMGAGTHNFLIDLGVTARSQIKRLLPAQKKLKDLQPGEGGIVTYEKGKVGAYRREDDEIFLVSVKCPHLGCELSWNAEEHTWECPCHGSRFDYRGNLLNGPATSHLIRY